MQLEELIEVILAANFMDVKSLLELCCAQLAFNIKGMSIKQMRQYFCVENDFTPEEEA